jgi:copper chaperone CopZ
MNKSKTLIGSGIITALAASLCCITPFLAIIAGTGGAVSSFSWLEPYRPYLMGISILVLAFAWYQKLKPIKKDDMDCACDTKEKSTFFQSKIFLAIITVFTGLMLAFPNYSETLYPKNKIKSLASYPTSNILTLQMDIEGMTCQACTHHIEQTADDINGVINTNVDFESGTAEVEFDISKTSKKDNVEAINKTNYKVKNTKIIIDKTK